MMPRTSSRAYSRIEWIALVPQTPRRMVANGTTVRRHGSWANRDFGGGRQSSPLRPLSFAKGEGR